MARRSLRRLPIFFVVLALLSLGSSSGLAAARHAAAPAACGATWRVFSTPPPADGGPGIFYDVAGTSPHDVWAVGRTTGLGFSHGLIEHWDGSAWTEYAADSADNYASLQSVATVSATDAWAVGFDQNPADGSSRAVIEHWDGSAWSRMTAPRAGNATELLGVAAISPTDAVAVGRKHSVGSWMNYAIRWTGSEWKRIPTFTFGHNSALRDVAMSSAHDVWAVGGDGGQVYVIHGDGATWTNVPVPTPGRYVNYLNGVDAIAPDDVWAVGESESDDATTYWSSWHWDGSSWTVRSDGSSEAPAGLEAVAHVAADDVWMVGNEPAGLTPMLAKHWDGTSVSPTSVPTLRPRSYGHLHGVAVIQGQVWVAGEELTKRTHANHRALIARMCPA